MSEESNENKEDVEDRLDESKKKKEPWWKQVPPVFLISGLFLLYLALQSIMRDAENKNQYFLFMIIVVAALFFMSQSSTPVRKPVSPKEAELLVEREIIRKIKWEQFPLMSKYMVGPVSNAMHRDGGGMYYDVSVKIIPPYEQPINYIAKVMMSGLERGYVTIQESLTPMTGREKYQETLIIPKWLKRGSENTLLGNVIDDAMRGKRR